MKKELFAKVYQERSGGFGNFRLVSLVGYHSFSRVLSEFGHGARLKILIEGVSKQEFVEKVYGGKEVVKKK